MWAIKGVEMLNVLESTTIINHHPAVIDRYFKHRHSIHKGPFHIYIYISIYTYAYCIYIIIDSVEHIDTTTIHIYYTLFYVLYFRYVLRSAYTYRVRAVKTLRGQISSLYYVNLSNPFHDFHVLAPCIDLSVRSTWRGMCSCKFWTRCQRVRGLALSSRAAWTGTKSW